MAEMTPELRAAIDAAKERVKVDSYFSRAMKGSVQGRTQGLWSGSFLGLFSGGLVGGLAHVGLALLAPGLAIPALLPMIAGVASIGAGIGAATGMVIGAPGGAVSAALAEKERREKGEKLEQEILASPAKQQEAVQAYQADPVVEKDTTVRETLATYKDKGKAWAKLIDLKTMGLAAAVCAGFSALICAGAFALAGAPTLVLGYGLVAGSTAAAATMGAVLGAVTGSLFGFNFPVFFSSLCEKAGDLLSGKMVRGKTGAAPLQTAAEMQAEAVRNREQSAHQAQGHTATIKIAASEVASLPENRIQSPANAAKLESLAPQLQV